MPLFASSRRKYRSNRRAILSVFRAVFCDNKPMTEIQNAQVECKYVLDASLGIGTQTIDDPNIRLGNVTLVAKGQSGPEEEVHEKHAARRALEQSNLRIPVRFLQPSQLQLAPKVC